MARRIYVFDPPDRFVSGTVGQPGQRTFFLQAAKGGSHVSVVLEKVQVGALAERMVLLLDALEHQGVTAARSVGTPVEDAGPLDEPIIEAFRVGTLTLAWDGEDERIVVEARELRDEDEATEAADEPSDDDPTGPDLVRVRIEPGAARAFASRAARIVEAGRPPCPWCGMPLNPEGHICPRRNGYLN